MQNPVTAFLERRADNINRTRQLNQDDIALGHAVLAAAERTLKENPLMPDIATHWPSRETLAVTAWILSTRTNIDQAKKIVADAKDSSDPSRAVVLSLQAWIDSEMPVPTAQGPVASQLTGALLLAAMEQVEWSDLALRLTDLCS